MAALLDVDVLRQHVLPPAFMVQSDVAAGFAQDETFMVSPATRPRLVAVWHLAVDGRPACCWSVGDPVIRGLPPN